jgi:hypothetical protein
VMPAAATPVPPVLRPMLDIVDPDASRSHVRSMPSAFVNWVAVARRLLDGYQRQLPELAYLRV